ncbi:helix-turn-helix transcriptional regulator [Paenibacillus sp. FSL M7-0656]|uniref:helix-turn-helix domain-containing protein n=1 Tax=Paenibacillus sp. FSL M7-0656 TaxID=2921534 RepID=UPI0030F8933A
MVYTLDATSITKNTLARQAKVRPDLIYDLYEGKTKRLDLDTLNNIVNTLRALTGNDYTLNDVLEYIPDDDKG